MGRPLLKPQAVRLLDVFVIGPLMAYGGAELSRKQPLLGGALFVSGVLTVVYNGRNYYLHREGGYAETE